MIKLVLGQAGQGFDLAIVSDLQTHRSQEWDGLDVLAAGSPFRHEAPGAHGDHVWCRIHNRELPREGAAL